MKKVSIIGAGQLGSRHLQGLKTAQSEMGIWVIDASEESLKVAKERCEAVESKTPKTVHYEQNIDVLPQNLDLVIVATGSKPRASIIKALLAHSTVSYLVLEKFLFTRLQDYDEIEALLKEKGVKSWVNCPRRMWPSYEAIKKLINKDKPVSFEFAGQNWGMCCNSIHLVDIWMYLAGDAKFDVDLSEIEPQVIESKRPGYIELIGKESFRSSKDDYLSLGCFSDYNGDINVVITNDGNTISLNEGTGVWSVNRGEEHLDKTPFQSGLTGIVADEILTTGECRLTPYSKSAQYHKPYLQAVMQFVNKLQGNDSDSCPIT